MASAARCLTVTLTATHPEFTSFYIPPHFFRLLLLRRLRLPLLITEARCGIMTTGLRVHAPARCVPVLAPSNALQLESAEKPASVT